MENIAWDYDVSKSRISDAIKWVEETLVQDGRFALHAKGELVKNDTELLIAIVDVTEQETERPKKNRANHTQASKNATR